MMFGEFVRLMSEQPQRCQAQVNVHKHGFHSVECSQSVSEKEEDETEAEEKHCRTSSEIRAKTTDVCKDSLEEEAIKRQSFLFSGEGVVGTTNAQVTPDESNDKCRGGPLAMKTESEQEKDQKKIALGIEAQNVNTGSYYGKNYLAIGPHFLSDCVTYFLVVGN